MAKQTVRMPYTRNGIRASRDVNGRGVDAYWEVEVQVVLEQLLAHLDLRPRLDEFVNRGGNYEKKVVFDAVESLTSQTRTNG